MAHTEEHTHTHTQRALTSVQDQRLATLEAENGLRVKQERERNAANESFYATLKVRTDRG